jgi:hypothetical protein
VAKCYLVLTHCRLVAKDTAERSSNSFNICKDKKNLRFGDLRVTFFCLAEHNMRYYSLCTEGKESLLFFCKIVNLFNKVVNYFLL